MKKKLLYLLIISILSIVNYSCNVDNTIDNDDTYPEKIVFALYDELGELLNDEEIKLYNDTIIVVIFLLYDDTDIDTYDITNGHYANILGITSKNNFLISSTNNTIWYSYSKYSDKAYQEMLEYTKHSFVDYILVQNDTST